MTKQAYNAIAAELTEIEARTGVYLHDENVDAENARDAGLEEGTDAYWAMMLDSAAMAAGGRAEEAGLDINKLVGRTIY